ncbi:MAG: hypothetical protein ACFFCS_17750 [Candidatus Hodarchaeota archaeon]
MFKHKHRAEEIPDFKGFLVYLERTNRELHERYKKALKVALIGDILVFVSFITALLFIVLAIFNYINSGPPGDFYTFFIIGIVFIGLTIASSGLGRRGHSQAIHIESEIVVEYHRSGFSEGNYTNI